MNTNTKHQYVQVYLHVKRISRERCLTTESTSWQGRTFSLILILIRKALQVLKLDTFKHRSSIRHSDKRGSTWGQKKGVRKRKLDSAMSRESQSPAIEEISNVPLISVSNSDAISIGSNGKSGLTPFQLPLNGSRYLWWVSDWLTICMVLSEVRWGE